MHTVAVLALEGFVAMDLAIPSDIFGRARSRSGETLYAVSVCGGVEMPACGLFAIKTRHGLNALSQADTIVIPGVTDLENPAAGDVLDALQRAAARGARLASICTGAFVLAKAGLLDGLRATTHWRAAHELASRYPLVAVEPNVLFIDNGRVLTSAGVASGVDLCLHMLRKDHGAEAAADAAAEIVMPPERSGGQAQLIRHEAPHPGVGINDVMLWLQEHLGRPLSVEETAKRFNMSARTLARRFREQTGTTPLQWILGARIRRAQQLLETTALSVEGVAAAVGFESGAAFRDRFRRVTGVTPTAWRNTYGSRVAASGHGFAAKNLLEHYY